VLIPFFSVDNYKSKYKKWLSRQSQCISITLSTNVSAVRLTELLVSLSVSVLRYTVQRGSWMFKWSRCQCYYGSEMGPVRFELLKTRSVWLEKNTNRSHLRLTLRCSLYNEQCSAKKINQSDSLLYYFNNKYFIYSTHIYRRRSNVNLGKAQKKFKMVMRERKRSRD